MLTNSHVIVDLTHNVNSETVTWSGSCGFSHENRLDYADNGIRVQKFKILAATGTHMDAPSHFFEGGRNIGDIDVNELFAPLVVIDVGQVEADFFLEVSHIREFEKKHGKIVPGSMVAFHSGWDRYFLDGKRFRNLDEKGVMHFPGMSAEVAELLLERGVTGVGIDTLSPDGSIMEVFPVHRLILGNSRFIVENMANLDKLPPVGASILTLPLKIEIGSESPTRSVALVPKDML